MTFPRLQNRINSEMVLDKVTHVTLKTDNLTYDMDPFDHVVIVTNESGEGIVNLPPVAEAAGQTYMVYLDDDSGDSVDVKSQGDEITGETDIADGSGTTLDVATGVELATAGDNVLLFCTGVSWHILAGHGHAST